MKRQKTLLRIFGLLISLTFANFVLADDIEVYGVNSGSGSKPNVLFIIDNSGSMNEGTNGETPSIGEDSKSDILKQVFDQVISSSVGKINAGLVLFNDKTSGVKWPVTDLTTIASTIDPDITGGLTSRDVLSSLVQYSSGYDATNYVSPLIEARAYFQGAPVWFNDWDYAPNMTPPVWSGDHYNTGWPQYWTPNKATYLPQDAFKTGNNGTNPLQLGCWDGSPYDANASNNCEGQEIVPNSCVYHPESTYTSQACHVAHVCSSWNAEGECNGWACPAGQQYSTNYTSAAHDICDYYFGSWEAPNYLSPIGSACQDNFIILLSDGLPTNNDQKWKAEQILSDSGVNSCANMGSMFFGNSNNDYGDCAAELIENMATIDMVAATPGSTIKTFTIGFGLLGDEAIQGSNYLTYLAQKGGGEFFAADSYDSLVSSLNSVIDSISGEADDFTGISVGVRNSSFSNDNRAYINLFKPNSKRSWPGNMKGYFLSSDGLLDINGNAVIDADGAISQSAQSFWSSNEDGGVVVEGGLDETISSTGSRNLYTYTGSASPSNIDLTSTDHALTNDNVALTNTMLGVTDQATRDDLLDWVATAPISDPLHAKPAIAKYSTGEVVFTMSNQGFIHAIDAASPINLNDESGGNELYAFIPKELLINLGQIKTNLSTGSHIYGLDGQITLHHEDNNQDGVINSNEVARLYIGMRRGGNNYYALDISNRTSPKLLWQIKGGEGDFAAMGQSWSRMALTTLKHGTNDKVLIFGGGYDESEDSKTARSAGKGNRVFIINSATGAHIWSVGSGATGLDAAGMIYSIATDIALIDINGNGYTDHLYFGDMGGQLWRVKFKETLGSNGAPTNNFTSNATAKMIGDFGASANRKFFYPPAVALMSRQGSSYLAITIGSGNRAHPLNESIQDMIFMVRDSLDTPLTSTLLLNDLYDATNNLVGQGEYKAAERSLMNAADGWYMELGTGEKSLSKMVVFDRKLRFTTYEPTEIVTQACSASSSSKGRYYVMNLGDATPTSDQIVDESELTKENRSTELAVQGIASEPNIIFPSDGNTVEVFVGKENISTVAQGVKQLYWKQIH